MLGERLAMVVWSGPDGVISEETERVFERGFNHWVGRQIRFWVDVIRLRWKLEGNEWSGMPDRTKSALTALLSVQAPKSIYIKAVAAGYFNFFLSADEGWATESILPLFDWQDGALARELGQRSSPETDRTIARWACCSKNSLRPSRVSPENSPLLSRGGSACKSSERCSTSTGTARFAPS